MVNANQLIRASAFLGFLGVAAGAFGAHALKDSFGPYEIDLWKTATFYHLTHVVAALIAINIGSLRVAICFLVGLSIFSGSLYALALTGIKILGAITPIGGVLLLIGWLSLCICKDALKV